jgi:GH15 family glucan-1,4-alpha-glucosidase
MYGIRGERILTEETLDHLAGYADSRPVRIGNAAYTQKQNDVFGYLLDVINTYYHVFPGTLDDIEEMWEIVGKMAKTVMAEWHLPDQSIWEFRGKREHFVLSKVMCWVALDRAAQIAAFLGRFSDETRIRAEAEVIREEVFAKGWNPKIQSFSQYYGSEDMDASLLLMEQYGFIDAADERYVKTVDRIRQELFHDGLLYRYKNRDDFGLPSSAFTICVFWLVRALYVTGRQKEAVALFDEIITYCNHVGLFSEDLDFSTRRQLGNFPQAYSHLALIDVVELISKKRYWSTFILA